LVLETELMSSGYTAAAGLKSLLPACLLVALIVFAGGRAFAQSGEESAQSFYEEAQAAMADEDWYSAAEDLLECLNLNPAHSEAAAALAECYYELGEYDEALTRVKKARLLSRGNTGTANLEAFILIAQGRLAEAEAVIKEALAKEPYNRETLFAAAELDIANGRSGQAAQRFGNAVKLYPDDRRLLLSLALVLGSLGDYAAAENYIKRAKAEEPDDYRVFYYAAFLEGRSGRLQEAINDAERALFLRPGFEDGVYLLASLRYRAKNYQEAVKLSDEVIAQNRGNFSAWFLKGMSLGNLGRLTEAARIFESALASGPDDEFTRAAFEKLLIDGTDAEDPARIPLADYHFRRAKDYKERFLNDNALFEYRRGLRICPYSDERAAYAEMLKTQGYPGLAFEELKFLQDLGKGTQKINDAVEAYTALLKNALPAVWEIKNSEIKPGWNLAVFSLPSPAAYYHPGAAYIASSYIKDILIHDRKIKAMDLPVNQASFAGAFRLAREAKDEDSRPCDYFVILSVLENSRELSVKAELYLARTGAKVGGFDIQRAGADRLRSASLDIVSRLDKSLPFRGTLLRRAGGLGIIDLGKIDGAAPDAVFNIVKKGTLRLNNDAPGFNYLSSDLAGAFAVKRVDEEVSAGELSRAGFFDLIEEGDEVILPEAPSGAEAKAPDSKSKDESASYDPELRSLLMKLR